MIRTLIIATALMFALTTHAAAQKQNVQVALTQLHGLCEHDYSPRVLSWGFTSEKFRQGKRVNCAPLIQSGFGGSVGSHTGLPLPCLVRKECVTSTNADAVNLF